ncbi:MAG: hypothetical protein ACK52L_09995 [Pirellula sp.]
MWYCATNKPKISPTADAQSEVAIAKRLNDGRTKGETRTALTPSQRQRQCERFSTINMETQIGVRVMAFLDHTRGRALADYGTCSADHS